MKQQERRDQEQDVARQTVLDVHERLVGVFGLPERIPSDPTEELVRTILSQNTNDVNRDRAYDSMWQRYGSWEAVAAADPADLADAIRVGGLGITKAPRIQLALAAIHARTGSYDLSFVCDLGAEAGGEWLQALPGVGPKTAACVLLFSCGLPVLPVDTHIYRVTGRLGLIPPRRSLEEAHRLLGTMVPPELIYPWHINVIRHGRVTCKAQKPRCDDCCLADLCTYAHDAN